MARLIRLEVGALEGEHKLGPDNAWMEKPVKMVYAGKFKSMDGDVEIKDEDIDKLVSNHNSLLAKVARMAKGAVPLTHQPPIQLDHSTSATHTVGRLVGDVTHGEHTDDEGGARKALMGTARILGKENVEKVLDGRWATVSIGADLEEHKITELSITPFPAAAGASLLAAVKEISYGGRQIKVVRDKDHANEDDPEEDQEYIGSVDGKTVCSYGDVGSCVEFCKEYIDKKGHKLAKLASYKGFQYKIVTKGKDPYTRWGYEIEGVNFGEWFDSATEAGEGARKNIDAHKDDIDSDLGKKLAKLGRSVFEGKHKGIEFTIIKEPPYFFYKIDGEKVNKYQYETENEAIKWAKVYIEAHQTGLAAGTKNQTKLSQGEEHMGMKEVKEKAALYEKCRKHLTDHKKMGEEEADKHLEAADDEKLKHMAEEHDAHAKHLADEAAKKEKEEVEAKGKLSAHKAGLVKLAQGFKAAGVKVQLAEKASKIHVRLTKLRADAKISPAELKGINIDELAGKSEEVIEARLSSYDSRQPVIDTGLIGSTKAMTGAQLAHGLKKIGMEREELQTRLNMPSKREGALKRLAEIEKEEKHLEKQEDAGAHLNDDGGDDDKHLEACLAEYKKMADEGKHDEAKEHLKSYMKTLRAKHLADQGAVSNPTPAMSALAAEVKSMQDSFNEFIKLTAPAFGVTVEELI